MTNAELINILKPLSQAQTNPIGVFSVRAKIGTKLPYLVALFGVSSNLEADNHVYSAQQGVTLELYTKLKDETSEGLVEKTLNDADLPWSKDEAYDDDQQFYVVYYYITRR